MIKFSGLSDGEHHFHFEIGKAFFEQLEYSLIEDGKLAVDVELDKSPTMLNLNFKIKGTLNLMCDKCTDRFDFPVEGSESLIYKFTDETIDDEKIRTISSAEVEIDLTEPIYEFTAILLPARAVHPEGECNAETIDAMDEYLMVEEQINEDNVEDADDSEIDPRWNELKKLKDN